MTKNGTCPAHRHSDRRVRYRLTPVLYEDLIRTPCTISVLIEAHDCSWMTYRQAPSRIAPAVMAPNSNMPAAMQA